MEKRQHKRPRLTPEGKRIIPGEAALAFALVTLAFAAMLLTKSDSGLASITLLTFVCYTALPSLSYGIWNNIIQCAIMLTLILTMRRIKPGYIISFAIALLLGALMDLFSFLLADLPNDLIFRIFCWLAGFAFMALAVCLLNACNIPTMPMETFTRDVTAKFGVSYRRLRTCADILFLAASVAIGLLSKGRLVGIGVGSVLMIFLGTAVSLWWRLINRYFVFEPRVEFIGRLSR